MNIIQKMLAKAKIPLLLFLFLNLTSCPDKVKHTFEQTIWELDQTAYGRVVKSSTERSPSLTFSLANGRFSGFGGCNEIMGEFTIDKNNLKIIRIGGTKMNCPNGSAENLFLSSLHQVNQYQLKDGQLTLLRDKSEVLVFVAN